MIKKMSVAEAKKKWPDEKALCKLIQDKDLYNDDMIFVRISKNNLEFTVV